MTNTVFWQTIADYNRMSWPVQVLLVLAGIVLTWRLYRRPAPGVRRVMKY